MKNGGRIPWSVTATNHSMIECHPVSAKDPYQDSTSSARKFYLEYSSKMSCMRENLERRHLGHRHRGIGKDGRIRNPR